MKGRSKMLAEGLTQARLKEVLDYDPDTGVFIWKERISIRITVGSVAGWLQSGYLRTRIDGVFYYQHRLAWLWVHGVWPPEQIDHKDMNRENNRIANLRLATKSQNGANARVRSHSKNGLKGIIWDKQRGRWRARIRHDGRVFHLGDFHTALEAHNAYVSKAQELFGDFARAA